MDTSLSSGTTETTTSPMSAGSIVQTTLYVTKATVMILHKGSFPVFIKEDLHYHYWQPDTVNLATRLRQCLTGAMEFMVIYRLGNLCKTADDMSELIAKLWIIKPIRYLFTGDGMPWMMTWVTKYRGVTLCIDARVQEVKRDEG